MLTKSISFFLFNSRIIVYFCRKLLAMDIQITDTDCISSVEYGENIHPVGITVEDWMDKLDKRLIDHFGEDFRERVNASRKQWNEKGRWHFDML